jgi:hypothetical protein
MVGWYDPQQLLLTGLQTVLSSWFGRRADFRLLEALTPPQRTCDYTKESVLWIDYISDLGDGFNATYAMAKILAREELAVGEGGEIERLPRGRVLVMGGDEVYPTPSRAAYEARLVMPYRCALPAGATKAPIDLFAIPGNHDWYDGLGSFMDLFCHGKTIGAYATPQSRSYFALHIAEGWWLFGVDIQLASDIDNPQKDYFLSLGIKAGDRIILCTPEPDWIYGNIYDGKNNLGLLESLLAGKGAKIVLKIAGDLHHYRRHVLVSDRGVHLVTAGGGGAFLHPTHTHDVSTIRIGEPGKERMFSVAKEYPDRSTSFWLSFQNLLFPIWNPWFGLVTAFQYTILSWVMPVPPLGKVSGLAALERSGAVALVELAQFPSSLVWVVVILLGFVAFTDTQRNLFKWVGGVSHGLAHLVAAFLVAALCRHLFHDVAAEGPIIERAVLSLGSFVGGYWVGGLLMGVYLLIAVNLFKRHGNEAFSSLKIEGYKNFLRMRLDDQGLTVWALGLRRVPSARDWEWAGDADGRGSFRLKAGIAEPEPEIIDRFFIPASGSGGASAR